MKEKGNKPYDYGLVLFICKTADRKKERMKK
jgi:hypothetical protein